LPLAAQRVATEWICRGGKWQTKKSENPDSDAQSISRRFLHINRTNMPSEDPRKKTAFAESANFQKHPRNAKQTNHAHATAIFLGGIWGSLFIEGALNGRGYGRRPQNLISVMLHSSRNKRKSAGRHCRMPKFWNADADFHTICSSARIPVFQGPGMDSNSIIYNHNLSNYFFKFTHKINFIILRLLYIAIHVIANCFSLLFWNQSSCLILLWILRFHLVC